MSIFDSFKPKYAHRNPEVRKASISTIRNPQILLSLALRDADFSVRKAATEALAEAGSEVQLCAIVRSSKDLELRKLACKKITAQGLLADIVKGRLGGDADFRKMAWERLTDQDALTGVFVHMYSADNELTEQTLKKLGDPASTYLQLIGNPPSVKYANSVLKYGEVLKEFGKSRADILDSIKDGKLRQDVIDKAFAKLTSSAGWSGERQKLIHALAKWRNLQPTDEKRIEELKSQYTSTEVCRTILDVIDNISDTENIESAGCSERGIHIRANDQFAGKSGIARATRETVYEIVTDGTVFFVFSSGSYLENW